MVINGIISDWSMAGRDISRGTARSEKSSTWALFHRIMNISTSTV
jgi:hypothetical protein